MLSRKQRRHLLKKKDRNFQSDGNPRPAASQETEYIECPACGRTVELSNSSKHHIEGRSHMDTRHDEQWSIRLCNSTPDRDGCHEEAEKIGNKRFAEKYAKNLSLREPVKYVLLMEH